MKALMRCRTQCPMATLTVCLIDYRVELLMVLVRSWRMELSRASVFVCQI